jgi:hypothetical protein
MLTLPLPRLWPPMRPSNFGIAGHCGEHLHENALQGLSMRYDTCTSAELRSRLWEVAGTPTGVID